jgi:hypothetical protein
MSDLDDQIRDALQAEHNGLADDDDLDYEGMMEMFRGHRRWVTIFCFSFMVVMVTVMVVSAVQFFRVESVRSMIAWATVFTVCIILEALVELWFLMECSKNALRCEVKGLVLQVAALGGRLGTEEGQGGH